MKSSEFPSITDELLSAYLDDAITEQERAWVEAAAAAEPEIAWRLDSLRQTVKLLQSLPELPLPRSFVLQEAQVGDLLAGRAPAPEQRPARAQPPVPAHAGFWATLAEGWRGFWQGGNPALRNAMATSFVLLLLLLVGTAVLPGQSGAGRVQVVSSPSSVESSAEQAAQPAQAVALAPTLTAAPDTSQGAEAAAVEQAPAETAAEPSPAAPVEGVVSSDESQEAAPAAAAEAGAAGEAQPATESAPMAAAAAEESPAEPAGEEAIASAAAAESAPAAEAAPEARAAESMPPPAGPMPGIAAMPGPPMQGGGGGPGMGGGGGGDATMGGGAMGGGGGLLPPEAYLEPDLVPAEPSGAAQASTVTSDATADATPAAVAIAQPETPLTATDVVTASAQPITGEGEMANAKIATTGVVTTEAVTAESETDAVEEPAAESGEAAAPAAETSAQETAQAVPATTAPAGPPLLLFAELGLGVITLMFASLWWRSRREPRQPHAGRRS